MSDVRPPRRIAGDAAVAGDWTRAKTLPEIVAEAWREPERWRRLAEDHAGGQRYLALPDFLTREAAAAIRDEVRALPFARLKTELLEADRKLLSASDIKSWLNLLQDDALRALIGDVLGREQPRGLVVNAWRMARGHFMGVHPDGRLYHGTLSLGLVDDWHACDGGAIAFGDPQPDGFVVRQRWYPHLGDALLFAPDVDTWHCVEPVRTDRVRHSLTGWWVAPPDGLTRGRDEA